MVALLTPGMYIAITNFNVEMIPFDLLLAITATRESVPFLAIIEVALMEISFELVREASIRIPTSVGPTIGIIGVLILGQVAVESNIVTPILVIVVAITGLSSFTISDASLSYMIRIGRFIFLVLDATLGLLGISIGIAVLFAYVSTVKSSGIPFFAPKIPYYSSSKDLLIKPSVLKEYIRTLPVHTKKVIRKKRSKGERINDE